MFCRYITFVCVTCSLEFKVEKFRNQEALSGHYIAYAILHTKEIIYNSLFLMCAFHIISYIHKFLLYC